MRFQFRKRQIYASSIKISGCQGREEGRGEQGTTEGTAQGSPCVRLQWWAHLRTPIGCTARGPNPKYTADSDRLSVSMLVPPEKEMSPALSNNADDGGGRSWAGKPLHLPLNFTVYLKLR